MLLHEIVDVSRRVAGARARLEKTGLLAECLRRLAPDEIAIGIAFLAGEPRQGRFGLGYAGLRAAAGGAATTSTHTLADVDATFETNRGLRGGGSAGARARALAALLSRATADEQEFLARLAVGELRQGALEGVMAEAVARAADVPAPEVRRALMLAPDLGAVAYAALTAGRGGLGRFRLELFRPLAPMLAETAADAASAFARVAGGAAEPKLDGARVQVHRRGGDVRVFTRSLNDVTAAVPEVVAAALALPLREVVLDGEAIVLAANGMPEPFQVTMRRFGRKVGVAALARELPLAAFFFDCLHLDGEDLLDRPTAARWEALAARVPAAVRVPRRVVEDPRELEAALADALAHGHEGVMLKAADAPYEAGRRGAAWLKLKPAHTLDLVVLAAEWGSGRRRGWLSNLHLGARDPVRGGFVMLGKTFKGMTDEMLRWQTERLLALELGREGHVVHVRPELVVEVACDGVQASPQYPGGVALRFARVRRHRPDKRAEEADVIDAVRALWGRA